MECGLVMVWCQNELNVGQGLEQHLALLNLDCAGGLEVVEVSCELAPVEQALQATLRGLERRKYLEISVATNLACSVVFKLPSSVPSRETRGAMSGWERSRRGKPL